MHKISPYLLQLYSKIAELVAHGIEFVAHEFHVLQMVVLHQNHVPKKDNFGFCVPPINEFVVHDQN
jgi:hypothetical protein